jgi:hypothetical protein
MMTIPPNNPLQFQNETEIQCFYVRFYSKDSSFKGGEQTQNRLRAIPSIFKFFVLGNPHTITRRDFPTREFPEKNHPSREPDRNTTRTAKLSNPAGTGHNVNVREWLAAK